MDALIQYVKQCFKEEYTGHDFFHAQRVVSLAEKMYEKEVSFPKEEELRLIKAIGYLHDVVDEKLTSKREEHYQEINSLLEQEGFSPKEQEEILYVIEHLSFSKNQKERASLSLLGQIVQDADRLDAIGAIGIARAFAFGGRKDQALYDERFPLIKKIPEKRSSSTLHHFYEKLFFIENQMNTKIGQAIAKERTQYLKKFTEEFLKEWQQKN